MIAKKCTSLRLTSSSLSLKRVLQSLTYKVSRLTTVCSKRYSIFYKKVILIWMTFRICYKKEEMNLCTDSSTRISFERFQKKTSMQQLKKHTHPTHKQCCHAVWCPLHYLNLKAAKYNIHLLFPIKVPPSSSSEKLHNDDEITTR